MRIVFCGEKGSLEESNVRKAGFDFYSISAYPLPVKGVGSYVSWFLKNLRGIVSSLSFLCKERPSLVFGTGGYVTGPLITAARLCRVPYFLHEQNSIPVSYTHLDVYKRQKKCCHTKRVKQRCHLL